MLNNKGMTLMEIVIALAIGGIVIFGITQFSGLMSKDARRTTDRLDAEGVKNIIRTRLDCEETMNALVGSGANSVLKNKAGDDIMPTETDAGQTVMVFNKWRVWVKDYDATTGALDVVYYYKGKGGPSSAPALFDYAPLTCMN